MNQQATPILQIPLTEVVSGVIRAIGYDAETKTLDVQLASSRTLRYSGVPAHLFKQLMADESAHWFYARWIRNKFPFVDLEAINGAAA